ncbi:uncharacterized protein LOC126683021 [Mercurialis annua]|uniref:uncharacterized protein LOC126683021 n=1 Tax=Mercurialis annua TaxID=3986 RepID=UPI00215EC80F|nr:uncharacterized protein LOC126683021 [Mercurialis annua]
MTNSDSDSDSEDEELRLYNEHVAKSGGFDVPDIIPKGSFFGGLIRRVDLSNRRNYEDVDVCAKFAIKHYNHLPENYEKKLKLVKVVKATSAGFSHFYVTLKARDFRGFVSVYETELFYTRFDNERSVQLFRPKRKKSGAGQTRQEDQVK